MFQWFLVEIYGNLGQITNKLFNQDQHGFDLTCPDSKPVTYDRQTLIQLKSWHTNAKLDMQTKLKITQLTIKGRFRRKRGEKIETGINTVTHGENTLLTHWIMNI